MPILVLSNSITLELDSLWRGLLTLAGVAVLVILAIVLTKLIGTISRLNRMLDEVTPDIKDTVGRLPESIQNVNDITGNVVDLTDDIVSEFPAVIAGVASISETASDIVGSAGSIFTELTAVLTAVIRFVKRPLATASVVRDVMHGVSKAGKKRRRK